MKHRSLPVRPLLAAALSAGWLAFSAPAWAEEIVYHHPDTCELVTIKCTEVLPETWTDVEYREREKGPTKKIPTALVVEIRRTSGGKDKSNLEAAVLELQHGNLTDARFALREVAGGGYKVTEGQQSFTSFVPKGASGAKTKRPAWTAEYAHFYYVKALVLEGVKNQNPKLLEEALLCLDDVPIPGGDAKEKETTGGFLGRFKGGNSRFYPEAMSLKATALIALKRFDEALAVCDELFKDVGGKGLSPRWAFEAKTAAGRIAEAQGDTAQAVQAYEQAPTSLEALLAQAPNRCLRLELGRWVSQMRARAAAIQLAQAEKVGTAAAFVALKTYVRESLPEAVQKKYADRPPEVLEALVAGARDPEVQAVVQTSMGLAYLSEKAYDEAIQALNAVAVRYFAAREYAADALYHLAQAADGAAQVAKGEGKALYLQIKDNAVKKLKSDYPESPFATK